ncbi:purine/pyrimidine permease [Rossellomorea vietnamensis]|uniref:purine/pyrimidine permease n=1 Tax=Rossellomorea vietnamensis TaxID=218284 RepID=UPI001CCC09CC|nr:purine/pyrimidine permease [Rossellomorea vietnamensis]MCA0149198.1 purine/pyrimidine permease [Rossellomorea vietnamensis]
MIVKSKKQHAEIVTQSFQWLMFMIGTSIALPIVIGNVFGLGETEISGLMQRTLFLVALGSILQKGMGHSLPIIEGPAGSWVSVFVVLAAFSKQNGLSLDESLSIGMGSLALAGGFLILMGLVKNRLFYQRVFPSLVSSVFLFLLAVQLSGIFFNGMIVKEEGDVDWKLTSLAFFVFAFIVFLSIRARGFGKQFSLLIGIIVGWGMFAIFGGVSNPAGESSYRIHVPELLSWGEPTFNSSIVVATIMFSFTLILNNIAAVDSMYDVYDGKKIEKQDSIRKGFVVGGINHWLSSLFSALAIVPLPVTSGFVQTAKQKSGLPFLIGASSLLIISFIPQVVNVVSTLPVAVASAALLSTIVNMFIIALKKMNALELRQREVTIIGISVLSGSALFFQSPELFANLPGSLQIVMGNGLIVGTVVVIVMNFIWRQK